MYKHILIATDGSELAEEAVAQGLKLAKALGAKVTAITVTEPWTAAAFGTIPTPSLIAAYDKSAAENAASILASAESLAKKQGVPCATLHVSDRQPAEGIVEAAKSKGCDLIVMASHGRRGVQKLLLGSEAIEVVTLSTIPVLICR